SRRYRRGRTNAEAPGQLGGRRGPVWGGWARARQLLGAQLARRGLALSGGALATALGQSGAPAAVPGSLLVAVVKAAALAGAGPGAAAGVVPARVADLAKGIVRDMSWTRGKILALVLAGFLASAAGVLGLRALAAGPPNAQGEKHPQQTPRAGNSNQTERRGWKAGAALRVVEGEVVAVAPGPGGKWLASASLPRLPKI